MARFSQAGWVLFLLAGCNSNSAPTPIDPAASPSAVASPVPTPVAASPPPSAPAAVATDATENREISPQGIGTAQLGMTLGQLKQALGPSAQFTVKSPFIVDFDAIAVSQDGAVKYYILYLTGQPFGDSDIIQGLLTDNPDFRTAAGVGPGTAIAQAEQVYGKATLSYNTGNESREYARFANQPATNLSFGTGNGNRNPAGIYASPSSDYNETQQFQPDAAIESVLIVCLTEDCTAPPAATP